jgi:hypothetical protein
VLKTSLHSSREFRHAFTEGEAPRWVGDANRAFHTWCEPEAEPGNGRLLQVMVPTDELTVPAAGGNADSARRLLGRRRREARAEEVEAEAVEQALDLGDPFLGMEIAAAEQDPPTYGSLLPDLSDAARAYVLNLHDVRVAAWCPEQDASRNGGDPDAA